MPIVKELILVCVLAWLAMLIVYVDSIALLKLYIYWPQKIPYKDRSVTQGTSQSLLCCCSSVRLLVKGSCVLVFCSSAVCEVVRQLEDGKLVPFVLVLLQTSTNFSTTLLGTCWAQYLRYFIFLKKKKSIFRTYHKCRFCWQHFFFFKKL